MGRHAGVLLPVFFSRLQRSVCAAPAHPHTLAALVSVLKRDGRLRRRVGAVSQHIDVQFSPARTASIVVFFLFRFVFFSTHASVAVTACS